MPSARTQNRQAEPEPIAATETQTAVSRQSKSLSDFSMDPNYFPMLTMVDETAYEVKSPGDLGKDLKAVLSELDALGAIEKRLNQRRSMIEKAFMSRMKTENVEGYKINGISIFTQTREVIEIDPECWDGVLDKITNDGHTHLLTRKLRDAGAIELFMDGWQFPPGMRITPVDKVGHRRTK